MSSNIRINKTCEYCKKEYIAKTLITRYCSHDCNRKDYKRKLREAKIIASAESIKNKTNPNFQTIQEKDFLTVKEVATILNMSSRTIYRLIESKNLNAYNFSARKTMIRRKDIDSYFDMSWENQNINKDNLKNMITLENSYTLKEVTEKYNISESALYKVIKRLEIPKKQQGKFTLVKKSDIDKIFSNHDD
ncbi:helix-turn-helix domain-containing protein [Flavobacterium chuncheonense]|uniref:Helix-turn-helix domain-containing protein n=1 Tax=Flavobacterium chuncheonense TaxID=2026653 RepID=A0ABW5YKA8_9FLAO